MWRNIALTKNSTDDGVYDPNAFVFSIDKKYKYNTNNPSYAIRSMTSRGPCFGGGCPFYIGNKFLTNNSSYSNPSNDYNCPPYVLTGAEYFTLDEFNSYTGTDCLLESAINRLKFETCPMQYSSNSLLRLFNSLLYFFASSYLL